MDYADVDTAIKNTLAVMGPLPFTTKEFVDALAASHKQVWQTIVKKHGKGGVGAGRHFSANSLVAQKLNAISNNNNLFKLDYIDAPDGWGAKVIRVWSKQSVEAIYPDEVDHVDGFDEGAKVPVHVNKYERDPKARAICIKIHGITCAVCDFDFESHYGPRGAGFIHVHHLQPLHLVGKSHKVNPKTDLRPVCANCHAMLHVGGELLGIDELKKAMSEAAGKGQK